MTVKVRRKNRGFHVSGEYLLILKDIYSITLSAVSSLMRKYSIDPRDIGRLEVGTETLLDKSKSVKSVLMQLFSQTNTNIEGIDTINACYGGTNALFNAVNWVESSSWDGRMAIVVAGDIAVYSQGPARPTGGAGAVAMLIGPDAPITLQSGIRGSYMDHVYDFFKPDFASEYPVVNGHYSLECYTRAVDECYKAYKSREDILARETNTQHTKSVTNGHNGHASEIPMGSTNTNGQMSKGATKGINGHTKTSTNENKNKRLITDRFDFMCFHSPTSKLVAKSFARLAYIDYTAFPDHSKFKDVDPSVATIDYEGSFTDRRVEKTFMSLSTEDFQRCVKPSMTCPNMCGNMYTASLYSGLTSLISSVEPNDLLGKAVGMFSYGSGLASTLFSLKVVGDTSAMRSSLNLGQRLKERVVLSPKMYEEVSAYDSSFAMLEC
jgi:hydroxymethylglutaryl-CoA synthase